MVARSVALVVSAVVLLSAGLVAPVPGASGAEVRAEVITDSVEGLASARGAHGRPVVDHDPGHARRLAQLDAAAHAHDADDPAPHDDHDDHNDHERHGGEAPQPHGAATGVLSEPFRPSIAFSLVGFSVPAGVGVSFRHRQAGGEWSDWEGVVVHLEERPDPDAAEGAPARDERGRAMSLPVWTGAADELQVRVDGGAPEDLAVHLVDGLGQNRDARERFGDAVDAVSAAVRHSAAPAAAAVEQPDIVTRSQWGARDSGSPSYASEARGAVLHHTVTSNDYTEEQAPAVVRSIQSYHLDHQRWKDIGYNFLIDRYGNVYEGRAGGVDEPVIGAHTAGHNTATIGVAFLGQHESETSAPSYRALDGAARRSAVDLLSWLFTVHGIDVHGTSTLPSGYTYPGWAHQMVGHGSLGNTGCPGSSVNAGLPDIRDGVIDAHAADDDGAGDREPIDGRSGGDTDRTEDPPGSLSRVAGPSRQATAVKIAGESHHRASTVLLASAADYPDALSGSALAGALDAPLLLTSPTGLDAGVADEIVRLHADRAVLLGSGGALGEGVAADLADLGLDVERAAGADRFATAAAVAARLGDVDAVLIANGVEGWPDAVAASQLAARRGWPVLLTATDELPSATAEALARLAPDRVLVVGGHQAVSAGVADELGREADVTRVAGADRVATAAAVADHAVDAGADARSVWLASAGDWPDALAAGPAAASRDEVLLLTWPDQLADRGAVADRLSAAQRVRLVGGRTAISGEVEHTVGHLLGH